MQSNPFPYRQFRLWFRIGFVIAVVTVTVPSYRYRYRCCRCVCFYCFSSCLSNRYKSHRLLFQLPFLFQLAFSSSLSHFFDFSFFVRIYSTTLFYCSISFVSFTVFYFYTFWLFLFVFFNAGFSRLNPLLLNVRPFPLEAVFEYSESAMCSFFGLC